MTPRERLTTLVSRHEGLRLKVYDDATGKPIVPGTKVKGHPTIGYGLALDVRGLTARQAAWLRDDILDEIEHQVATRLSCYGRQLDARRMALLELAFQCGVDGLLEFTRMIAALEARDYARARAELLDSSWARQTGAERVEAIAEMIGEGTWPSEAAA